MKIVSLGILLMTLVGLSACGFHLKGTGKLDQVTFQSVYLQNSGADPALVAELKTTLRLRDLRLTASAAQAEVVIDLGKTQFHRSTTGLSLSGNVSSELLKMTQPFSARLTGQEANFVKAKAEVYRDRSLNETAVLAAARELSRIRQEMAQTLVEQILDRVARSYQKNEIESLNLQKGVP